MTVTAVTTHNASKKYLFFLLIIASLFTLLRLMAPSVLEAFINKTGADNKGYHFKVTDLDLEVFKGKAIIKEFTVFKKGSSVNFAKMSKLEFDFDWSDILKDQKTFSVTGDQIDITVSKDLIEELNRVKKEVKEKTHVSIYLDRVVAKISKINVKEIRKGKTRTIVSLKDANLKLTDVGFGSPTENTEFNLTSKILEGGGIAIKGKAKLEDKDVPWNITGKMTGINAAVIEKLAGDRIPLDIKTANFNAGIEAKTNGGKIYGVITPDIKNLKLSEDKEEGFIKKNLAKAANFIFNKVKDDKKSVKLKLPFTLNENFTVRVPETIDMIQAQEAKR